jgi:hypothetical protein
MLRNSSEVYGFISVFIGSTILCTPFVGMIFIRDTVREEFVTLFFVGTLLQIVALVCCVCSIEKPFNYVRHYNERQSKLIPDVSLERRVSALETSTLYENM